MNLPPSAARRIGFHLALGAAVAVSLLALAWGLNVLGIGLDDSDRDAWHRSGLTVHTDHATGLQYLSAPRCGMVPRLDVEGRHIRAADRFP